MELSLILPVRADDRDKAICRKVLELSLILPLWWTIAVKPIPRSSVELLLILPLWWTIAVMLHCCGRPRSIECCVLLAACGPKEANPL